MQKKTKWKIAALFIGLVALTGCTKSFCTVQDKANMMVTYERADAGNDKTNLQVIIEDVNKTDLYFAPSETFFVYIEEKVAETVKSYYSSTELTYTVEGEEVTKKYSDIQVTELTSEGAVRSAFIESNEYALTKYAKEGTTSLNDIWSNYRLWRNEALNNGLTIDDLGTNYFFTTLESKFNTYTNSITACITPVDGVFDGLKLEGKSWGDAFHYGILEGLLVWPISAMLYYFATGMHSLGVGGIILSIFFVTLIIRGVLMLLTLKQTMSQTRMQELQPELEALQAKYPHAQDNQYEKQALAQEQMKLYKKYKINPFGMIITLVLQFIIFIPVWGAMQGSAILRDGDLFGLRLSAQTGNSILNWSGWASGVALILFIVMALAQAVGMFLPQFLQKRRAKKNGKTPKTAMMSQQAKTMKITQIVMFCMILFTGFMLPVAMAIYWTIAAIITLCQSLIVQLIVAKHSDKKKFAKYKTK